MSKFTAVFSFLLLFLIAGCASQSSSQSPSKIQSLQKSFTPILGSVRGWDSTSEYVVLRDFTVSGLRVRVTRADKIKCHSGEQHTIEVDGPINKDTAYVIEKLFKDLPACKSDDGKIVTKPVYLNSAGGTLEDGYAIGRVFRKYGASTRVTENQVCASSCALAFLGGVNRSIFFNGKLIFHAPYRLSYGLGHAPEIKCSDKNAVQSLRAFYSEMIRAEPAERLFDRTMDYCSMSDGWTVDSGAAEFFGLTGFMKR